MADIIRRSHVQIIKHYDRPVLRAPPPVDNLALASLRLENRALKDRIRRLESEITSEIAMLTAALKESKQETVDQVRRRVSRLRGSLEYPGRTD